MTQAIHLLDPVTGYQLGSQFPTMRCGRTQNFNMAHTPVYTTNPEEVTCTSCKSYINNPWRVLRKYGQVKVVEDMFVMFWGQYGYKFDMVAMTDVPGTWSIIVSYRGQLHLNLTTQAGNTTQLGFKLVDIIEAEIIKLKSPFNSPLPECFSQAGFAKGDEERSEPESSIQNPVTKLTLN
jgi:hypothetical protein